MVLKEMKHKSFFKLAHPAALEFLHPVKALLSYNRRFSTAIDLAETIAWCQLRQDDLKNAMNHYYKLPIDILAPDHDTITNLLLIALFQGSPDQSLNVTQRALSRAQECINLQIDWINSRILTQAEKLEHQTQPLPIQLESICDSLLSRGLILDQTMIKYQQTYRDIDEAGIVDISISSPPFVFYPLGKFMVLFHDSKYTLMPGYIIALIVSKMVEFGGCLLALSQQRRSDLRSHIVRMTSFIFLLKRILEKYKNKGHSLLKALDGLGHGVMTLRLDESHSRFLLDNMIRDLSTNFDKSDVYALVRFFESCPPFDITNFMGLAKILGYPTIDVQKGVAKLFQRTHQEIEISDPAIERVINMGKLLFLNQYHRRHKRYPTVTMASSTPKHIVRAILANISFTSPMYISEHGKVDPADMAGITLQQCMFFDWYDRFYPLLKDKASAPTRSRVEAAINDDTYPPGSRRVLLEYLRGHSVTTEWLHFRRLFSKNPRAVREQFVIKLTTKEKEQKLEGRMFGQSPLYERQRRIVGECNIAACMELYNSDQCMLVNEHDKRKILSSLSRAEMYSRDKYVIITSVDAEAWNNYFRASLVNEFGREIFDRIFDIDFYAHTMTVFNLGFIYHRDSADNVIYWDGQEGGIEGLAQKVWTWIYTVIARLVLHLLDLDGFMLVNGDDMRLIIFIDKHRVDNDEGKLREFQEKLLLELRDLFHLYGIRVKTDETNMTRSLLSFGKMYVSRGLNLPSDMKKIIKAGGLTDVGFPSLTDIISSIMSNAHSACGLSYQVIPNVTFAYTLTLIYLHCYRFITLVPSTSSAPYVKTEESTMLLTIPSCLGGLDTLLLIQFILQGESDPLPLALDWLMYLWFNEKTFRPAIQRSLNIGLSTILPIELLLSDLYSLPLHRPPRPMSLVTRKIRKFLPRFCKNSGLQQLINFDRQNKQSVINSLWKMTPFNPRIASYLYSLSPTNVLSSIIQKFESASTISAIIFRRDQQRTSRLFSNLITADRTYIGVITRRLCQSEAIEPKSIGTFIFPLIQNRICATAQASLLRRFAWRKPEMVDDTIPSVLQQLVFCDPGTADPSVKTYDNESVYLNHFVGETVLLKTEPEFYGPLCSLMCAPYYSHTTGLRLGYRLTELKGSEPLIQMIRKLTDAQALLAGLGSGFESWSDWSAMCLFGETLDTYCPSTVMRLGGSVGHRLPARSFERTVYINTLPSRSGRAKTTLDSLARKSGMMSTNRTHNYSAMTCYFRFTMTNDLENDLLSNGKQSLCWGILVSCRDIDGRSDSCMCHMEVGHGNYEIDPPSDRLIGSISRLIRSCELVRMPAESELMIDEYKKRFRLMWSESIEYDTYDTSNITEEVYKTASFTASALIADTLPEAQSFQTSASDVADVIEFMNTVHKISSSVVSAKDILVIDMNHLAQCLLLACMHRVLEAVSICGTLNVHLIRSIITQGVFLQLCYTVSITRSQGPFITAINDLLHTTGFLGIPLTFDVLSSPVLLARMTARSICDYLAASLSSRMVIPSRAIIYLPNIETEYTVEKYILGYLWHILIGAIVQLNNPGIYPIPRKNEPLISMSPRSAMMYTAMCAILTWMYTFIGSDPCPGSMREAIIPCCDMSELPQSIVVWDQDVGTIDDIDLTPAVYADILILCQDIISKTYLGATQFHLLFIRLPYKTCIEICKVWKEVSYDEPTETVIRPYNAPKPGHSGYVSFGAPPMESDLELTPDVIPPFVFDPLPRESRFIPDTASIARYYTLSTGALNKYLECLSTIKNYRSFFTIRSSILACADGSGGVAVLLTRLFINCEVLFNTLSNTPGKRTELNECPDEANLYPSESSRLRANQNASVPNDLSSPETLIYLTKAIEGMDVGKIFLLTCDAEAPNLEKSTIDKGLVLNLIRLINSTMSDGGIAIIKRFISTSWHCVLLYMYLASAFSHVSIFKPESSHNSSGEIFYIGINKVREWSKDRLEQILAHPSYTYESLRVFMARLTQLATARTLSDWSLLPIREYFPLFTPHSDVQTSLSPWRVTYSKICDQCRMLPSNWISDEDIMVSKDAVDLFSSGIKDQIISKYNSCGTFMKRAYAITYGFCICLSDYLGGETFSSLQAKIKESCLEMYAHVDSGEARDMHSRHVKVGVRICLALIGCMTKGIKAKALLYDPLA